MLLENTCCIVTAFYNFEKKKHTSNSYFEWIDNFLPNINAYMVIFTDELSYDRIYNLRKNYIEKTVIIKLKLEDFYCYKYIDYWKKDLERDHERGHHDINLYMIWNEKSQFLNSAINLNPFDTEFYSWIDIGMLRDPSCIKYVSNFPNKNKIATLKKDKVYLLNITKFDEDDLKIYRPTEKFRYQNDSVRIGGGCIFGHRDILKTWVTLYYQMLENFMVLDYFAGKDQSVMSCVYLKHRDLIELVTPQPSPFNHWFYMLDFLS